MCTTYFSIVTPSYNSLNYLKLCIPSVKDQGVFLQHIIVDSCSTDGTVRFLKNLGDKNYIEVVIAQDKSMYDALNKGLKLSKGNIVGHLNCDEQYLPGALQYVKSIFERHKDVDMVFGNYLTINADGSLNAFKKALPYRRYYVLSGNLYIGTCALFYRRKIVEDGYYFNTDFICSGDKEYIVRLHDAGYRSFHLGRYLSCYTVTGHNLSRSDSFKYEHERINNKYSNVPSTLLWMFKFLKILEKYCRGAYYSGRKISYLIYTLESPTKRILYENQRGSYITSYSGKNG